MQKALLIIFFICANLAVFSQKAHLITIDSLNSRVKKATDTTFVINFWATWCSPCIKELPHFERLNKQFKMEKLKVLLVSVDFRSLLNYSLNNFIKRKNIKSEVLLLNEKDPQEFINRIDSSWSGSIPATLIIKNTKRKFLEKDLTFDGLLQQYKLINQL